MAYISFLPKTYIFTKKENISGVTRDVEAEAGSWKRSFFCGSGSGNAKILPLPLPHRLFDLESNLAKKFCPFPNVD